MIRPQSVSLALAVAGPEVDDLEPGLLLRLRERHEAIAGPYLVLAATSASLTLV